AAQLLELRTQNYQLSDGLRKNSQELTSLRQKHGTLEKEFGKAQKALSKSKKAQEVEALLGENEMLQGKLHSQEDDFRLQNTTLMQELSKLCSQIEQLEAENARVKAAPSGSGEEDVQRLRAENSALQKRIATLQEFHEKEVGSRRCQESEANGHGATHREDGAGGSHPLVQTDGQADAKQDGLGACSWEPITDDLQGFQLKLETQTEENRLLRGQIQSLQTAEKLKKKHDSFLQLQGEKEALYNDSRTKIEEIQQKKEEEIKSLTLRNHKLQQDMQAAQQSCAELREQVQSQRQEHERALHGVQEQIQSSRTQELTLLREQNSALTLELQQQHHEKEAMLAQKEDLKAQLEESLRANRRLLEQLQEKEQESERLRQDLDEARKSADKRKAMLDELAMEMLQEKSRHKEALGNLKLQHEKETLSIRAKYEKELRELHEEKNRGEEDLRAQLRDEKARSRELEGHQQTSEELRLQIHSLEGTKGWFERRLKEAEETVEKNQMRHEEDLAKVAREHSANLQVHTDPCGGNGVGGR
uniref:GRIP1 associated protein 1 n=1 Tax=Xenopus tropicalis TaxID=8364 RepID=A0A803JBJ9_XENTR